MMSNPAPATIATVAQRNMRKLSPVTGGNENERAEAILPSSGEAIVDPGEIPSRREALPLLGIVPPVIVLTDVSEDVGPFVVTPAPDGGFSCEELDVPCRLSVAEGIGAAEDDSDDWLDGSDTAGADEEDAFGFSLGGCSDAAEGFGALEDFAELFDSSTGGSSVFWGVFTEGLGCVEEVGAVEDDCVVWAEELDAGDMDDDEDVGSAEEDVSEEEFFGSSDEGS